MLLIPGKVNGTLTVSSNNFANLGSAENVKNLSPAKEPLEEYAESGKWFSFFNFLITLGYFILGLILIRYLPGLFAAMDDEIRRSPIVKALVGFVLMIATLIVLTLVAITIIGLPIAVIGPLIFTVTLLLTGTFVSFSLGKWIGDSIHLKYGNMILFIVGFIILNICSVFHMLVA